MKPAFLFFLLFAILGAGCNAIKETSKQQMETGIYKVSSENNKHFYTEVGEDTITIHPVVKTNRGWIANPDSGLDFYTSTKPIINNTIKFTTRSLDLDIHTILFKYRPYTSRFPNQLNTNFNGAGYIGYRSDYYLLSYDQTPIKTSERRISHFAYSVGGFFGLGATNMNPYVTNNIVQSEYDGVVITKGIAGLIGVGTLTFGVSVGLDHLLDENKKVWIYQGKPFAGFIIGLNIN